MRNINVYVIVKVLHFVNRDVNAKAMGQDLFWNDICIRVTIDIMVNFFGGDGNITCEWSFRCPRNECPSGECPDTVNVNVPWKGGLKQ